MQYIFYTLSALDNNEKLFSFSILLGNFQYPQLDLQLYLGLISQRDHADSCSQKDTDKQTVTHTGTHTRTLTQQLAH